MICSLPVFDRPELLREVLESFVVASQSLLEASGEYARLIVLAEPSDVEDEIQAALSESRTPWVLSRNDVRLGLQANTLAVLEWAWRVAAREGDDFVVHLEDDLVLAPDALRLAAWMRDEYRGVDDVAYIGLTQTEFAPTPRDYLRVTRSGWFECHVWGTWRDEWERLRAAWPHDWPNHWAAVLNAGGVLGTRSQVVPLLSRSRSIGVVGTHCTPELHESHNPKVFAGDVAVPRGAYFE